MRIFHADHELSVITLGSYTTLFMCDDTTPLWAKNWQIPALHTLPYSHVICGSLLFLRFPHYFFSVTLFPSHNNNLYTAWHKIWHPYVIELSFADGEFSMKLSRWESPFDIILIRAPAILVMQVRNIDEACSTKVCLQMTDHRHKP